MIFALSFVKFCTYIMLMKAVSPNIKVQLPFIVSVLGKYHTVLKFSLSLSSSSSGFNIFTIGNTGVIDKNNGDVV